MKKLNIFTFMVMLFFLASSAVRAQVPENGLVLDGDDDFVLVSSSVGGDFNPMFNLTLECWVNLSEAAAPGVHRPHMVTKFGTYGLAVDVSGYARFFLFTDSLWYATPDYTTDFINVGQWYHLAATYDGSVARLYVNGVEQATTTINDTLNQNGYYVRLGAQNLTPDVDNMNGMLDEVRIWDVTRTPAQIRDNMNRTIPGNTAGLSGYWRFDESSGTNANDQTPNNNDGTLQNMSVPAAWQTSTAAVGTASIFAESADITETAECAVDVDFMGGTEAPGSGRSLAAMQVNQLPNSSSGLYADRANRYWEIWSEDPDFDGNFTADVRFHFDGITGLPTEPSLELFRRDDANDTWTAVSGETIVSNDGGSSTTTDGIGYVEITITESTAGDFSGQYILSWSNEPPVVSDIPDQSVAEGSAFATINLDDFVADPDHLDNQLTWTVTGEEDVTVVITDRVATITADDPEWSGTDLVTFTATDPEGESDSDDVTFEVTAVNDPPVVDEIPHQSIMEDQSFAQIDLDDYVADPDDLDNTLIWTVTGDAQVSVDITDRVATVTVLDPEWNGADWVIFTVADPDGLEDSDTVRFHVAGINDAPVVSGMPDFEVAEGDFEETIILDDFVADPDDDDTLIVWTVQGANNIMVNIANRIATITPGADPMWNGTDTLVFTATDTSGASDTDTSLFTVVAINNAPTVNIPIPDTMVMADQAFLFVLDSNTFVDSDQGDSLAYSAVISKGGATPAWITFTPATMTFSGTPALADTGMVEVVVTATDDSLASVADTFMIEVTSTVGVVNPLEGLELNLYPNPNDGRFVIESDMLELKDVVLEIFNERGQLVWNRKIMDGFGTLRESVDMSDAAEGLYLLRIRNKTGMVNKRFVIGN